MDDEETKKDEGQEPHRSKILHQDSEQSSEQDSKQPTRPIITVPPEENPEVGFDPAETKRRLRKSFLTVFIIGVVLILFPMEFLPYEGIIKIIFAVILMTIYGFTGAKYLHSTNTTAVFADSFYYLGFLFTFVALVGAIIGLNELNIQSIIGQMGPALVTTVIGMAVRIYLTQFEAITSEPETEAINTMNNLSAQIITSLKNLENNLRTCESQIEGFSNRLHDVNFSSLQREFSNLAESIRDLANSSKELKSSAEQTKLIIDGTHKTFDGLDASVSTTKQNLDNLDASVSNTRKNLDNIDISTGDIAKLNDNIEKTAETVEGIGKKLETRITTSATEAITSITDAKKEADKAKDEATNLINILKKTILEVIDFLNRKNNAQQSRRKKKRSSQHHHSRGYPCGYNYSPLRSVYKRHHA